MNRAEKRKRIKSVKIMGKRLSRDQRKYVYKESVKEEIRRIGNEMIDDLTEHENLEKTSYDIGKTIHRAIIGRTSKSKYF